MSQQTVFELLKELGTANIDEIFQLAKKKKLTKVDSRIKIRDSLILLSRKGIVKEENDKWIIVSEKIN